MRKVKYKDEEQPTPIIWTVVIAIIVLTALVVGAYTLFDMIEKSDLDQQYDRHTEKEYLL